MTDVHRPHTPPTAEEPLSELLRTATADLSTLFHQELELAKVEMKDDIRQAGKVGGIFGAGAVSGYLALLFASFALAWLLDDVMPRSLAFLLVGVLYGVVATVLFIQGRKRARNLNPAPRQTIETLKEDAAWARHPTS